ncbi:Na+-transporting NADH:ubiquinone oxidoreductase subunit B [Tindallia magadiensis]|uniref:Na+-transporting NADH:ubiquinone oxidoreductase subunit B n=1 Tax=Tindallia magadiensis TaxID=69895 RepID=A0A1I3AW48_9FIRM|nr:RnfABCDGE type electron transport complex subunit D [Tindallia magadiensis]SFH54297.1 Na+-transporting NADH:ubiquinone oxidoreductase subunit B [Tindallia magadiensis]
MIFHNKISSFFQKQPLMRHVLVSLLPLILGSAYLFGLRVFTLLIVVSVAGIATEYIFVKKRNQKVTEAVLVTCVLFTLSLPIATPYWVAIVGIVFGVLFAKEVFGGFGRNVFNPALVGRMFLYVSFPEYLTASWNHTATSFPGGFTQYITPVLDTVSESTPMPAFRSTGELLSYNEVLWGYTSGSIGETSAILLVLGALFLLSRKAADWRLILSSISGFLIIHSILFLSGVNNVPNPIYGLLTGGFLFTSIYFVTEPTTAPKTTSAKWIYGFLIGIITVVIRYFGIFIEGAAFSVLIMNTFVPIMDEGVKSLKAMRKKVKA